MAPIHEQRPRRRVVVLNLSKILNYHCEMMQKANDGDLSNNKTKKLLSRKIWIVPRVQDQEECARDARIQRMINRLDRPRSQTLLRADRFAIFQGTVDSNDRESFYCAMSSILYAVQYLGILPLAGVRSESPRKLAFKIYSPSTAYAVAIIVMLFIMALISVYDMIQTPLPDTAGSILATASVSMFYINSFLGTVFFMWLAPRWISLQRNWRAMERFLDRDKHQTPRLRWKFLMLTATVMMLALLEHTLYLVRNTPRDFWSPTSNVTVKNALQFFYETTHPQILRICNYNHPIGIFTLFVLSIAAFTWNFTDVFIMLVSVGLAERYKNLNRRLKDTITTYHSNVDWLHLRESYATLSTLVKTVDNDISPIILLSFVNNLYYICYLLFNGFSLERENVLRTISVLVSNSLLFGRTIAVTLLAAEINDESRVALPHLYNYPGPAYNIETQRLQHLLSTDHVCLTGMGLFSITRKFMLAVFSTIVTYEMLLLDVTSR